MKEPPHHPNQVKRLAEICFAVFDGDVFTKCRERRYVDARITFAKLLQEQGYGCSHVADLLGRDHSTIIHYFRKGEELIEANPSFRKRFVKAREEYIGEDPVFYYSAPELRAKFLEMRDECEDIRSRYKALRERIANESRLDRLIDMVRMRTKRGTEEEVYNKLNRIYNGL